MIPPSEAQRLELAASDTAPLRARRFAERIASQMTAASRANLLLVVTELVTNSVCHGPDRPITVELEVLGAEHVRGEIIDDGAPTSAQRITDTGLETPGGLGLGIVDQLSRRWGVREGSTDVWFELGPGR